MPRIAKKRKVAVSEASIATKRYRRRRSRRPREEGAPTPSSTRASIVAVRLGVNPKHADQMVRGAIVLPHGTGKSVRVAVFARGEKEKEALDAGADFAGGDDLAKKVTEGMLDFEVCIATPDMMGTVGKLGRILGPRGLMPNPKVGTVTRGRRARRSRSQGRQGRVPRRQGRRRALPHRPHLVRPGRS